MFNRSGGDEGYPMENINRNKQIVRYSGPMKGPSETVPQGQDAADVEFQIHCIETEAYTNVLRAFIAQSDVLSWGKEGLISELRKELRVSDVEHRKLLAKVYSDDSVRMIREWRKGPVGEKKLLSNSMKPTASLPCSTSLPSSKRLKIFQPPASLPSNYLPMSHHSSAPTPYSMAIHCKDDQWGGEMALFSRNATIQQSIRSGPLAHDSRQASTVGIGSRQVMVRSNKGQHPLDVNNSEKRSDVIRIRATDDLIHEVERVFFGQRSANPVEVAKAKMLLKEHEQAILEALDKLAPLADNDNSPGHSHQRYSYEGQQRNGHQLGSHDTFYGHPVHVPFTKVGHFAG